MDDGRENKPRLTRLPVCRFAVRGYIAFLMSLRPASLQLRYWAAANPVGREFWLTGIGFVFLYCAINLLTERFDAGRLAITPWSPDNGLSLMLLIGSVNFAPFVFIGAVLVDIFVVGVQRSLGTTLTSEFVLVTVYAGFALAVRNMIRVNIAQFFRADLFKLSIIIPLAALCSALVYVITLYLYSAVASDELYASVLRFTVGDVLGIYTLILIFLALYAMAFYWKVFSSIYCEESLYFAVFRSLAALRLLFFPGAMVELIAFVHRPNRLESNKRPLYFLVHKYYLSRKFTLRQRTQAALDHQRFETENYKSEYIKLVYYSDGLLLWRRCIDNIDFRLTLSVTDDNRHEGDLSVILQADGARLCRMSFSYLDAGIFGLTPSVTMLISRNQTDQTSARAQFDRCFKQNSPQFFCLAAICGIAAANGFSQVLAIKHDLQIAYEEKFDAGFRNSYSSLWEKFDAVEIDNHVYLLDVTLKLRELQLLDRSHRARARNRRQHWNEVFDDARSRTLGHRKGPGRQVSSRPF